MPERDSNRGFRFQQGVEPVLVVLALALELTDTERTARRDTAALLTDRRRHNESQGNRGLTKHGSWVR